MFALSTGSCIAGRDEQVETRDSAGLKSRGGEFRESSWTLAGEGNAASAAMSWLETCALGCVAAVAAGMCEPDAARKPRPAVRRRQVRFAEIEARVAVVYVAAMEL